VGVILGPLTTPKFPLYLAEALVVEAVCAPLPARSADRVRRGSPAPASERSPRGRVEPGRTSSSRSRGRPRCSGGRDRGLRPRRSPAACWAASWRSLSGRARGADPALGRSRRGRGGRGAGAYGLQDAPTQGLHRTATVALQTVKRARARGAGHGARDPPDAPDGHSLVRRHRLAGRRIGRLEAEADRPGL